MSEETITISKAEYTSLRRDALMLRALEYGGVDNWDWYSEAYHDFLRFAKKEGILTPEELEDLKESEDD